MLSRFWAVGMGGQNRKRKHCLHNEGSDLQAFLLVHEMINPELKSKFLSGTGYLSPPLACMYLATKRKLPLPPPAAAAPT